MNAVSETTGRCYIDGFHHVALVTDDLKAVIDFYCLLLGFRLIRAMHIPAGWGTGPLNRGNPPFEQIRYYFFSLGKENVLSFFEIPKGAMPRTDRNLVGGMQQIAFSCLPDEFTALHKRLAKAGVEIDDPLEVLPGMFAFNFWDPFGTRLEALCNPANGAEQRVVYELSQNTDEILNQLKELSDDPKWLSTVRPFIGTPDKAAAR